MTRITRSSRSRSPAGRGLPPSPRSPVATIQEPNEPPRDTKAKHDKARRRGNPERVERSLFD